ncbi:hypothetical protein BK133_11165 [Paenibacillus sp. FSL H8-0548]|nr:hypothetical protein BK133_11165 [Paenibacillus sp. FSL H8-0548]
MPTPSKYTPGLKDVGESKRNARASMLRQIIAKKITFDLSWTYLNAEDTAKVLTAVDAASFVVTFLDPKTNTFKTLSFYASDRSLEILDFINGVARYKELKFTIIEM